MAFSPLRGRPKSSPREHDRGTPELQRNHALGVTAEPIDLCLARGLISPPQHRASLHLRWLHTIRHGAPTLTTRYGDRSEAPSTTEEDPQWRSARECEYQTAIQTLDAQARLVPVMQVSIYNELPTFLNLRLQQRAQHNADLAHSLWLAHHNLCEGLEILTIHWMKARTPSNARKF